MKRLSGIRYLIMAAMMMFANVMKAEELSFVMNASAVYPGTVRTIRVYVPQDYKGGEPACLLVRMDYWSDSMLSDVGALIKSGEMPMTIIVQIEPGKVRDADGNVLRYNRSNEFDRTDGRFAWFLQTEVLPRVNELTTQDGRSIRVSERPCDRALYGDSSGGIAAFCAAWFGPDLFSRVYSGVGTFVPMRGGDQLAPLVRKTEPKRVRVFLQDNDQDSWNLLLGSWFEENNRLEGALQFAGYEVDHRWDKGGHDGINSLRHFREAMKFLWAGWPNEVGVGTSQNQTLADILPKDSGWKEEQAKVKSVFPDNPHLQAIYPGGGQVATLQEGSNWVLSGLRDAKGHTEFSEEFYYLHSQPRELLYDTAGYLYAATDRGVEICDHNGRVRAILSFPGTISRIALRDHTLFIAVEGRVYSRQLLRSGFTDADRTAVPQREGEG